MNNDGRPTTPPGGVASSSNPTLSAFRNPSPSRLPQRAFPEADSVPGGTRSRLGSPQTSPRSNSPSSRTGSSTRGSSSPTPLGGVASSSNQTLSASRNPLSSPVPPPQTFTEAFVPGGTGSKSGLSQTSLQSNSPSSRTGSSNRGRSSPTASSTVPVNGANFTTGMTNVGRMEERRRAVTRTHSDMNEADATSVLQGLHDGFNAQCWSEEERTIIIRQLNAALAQREMPPAKKFHELFHKEVVERPDHRMTTNPGLVMHILYALFRSNPEGGSADRSHSGGYWQWKYHNLLEALRSVQLPRFDTAFETGRMNEPNYLLRRIETMLPFDDTKAREILNQKQPTEGATTHPEMWPSPLSPQPSPTSRNSGTSSPGKTATTKRPNSAPSTVPNTGDINP